MKPKKGEIWTYWDSEGKLMEVFQILNVNTEGGYIDAKTLVWFGREDVPRNLEYDMGFEFFNAQDHRLATETEKILYA